MSPFHAAHNIRLYYAFSFTADFMLWLGIWIKYLIEVRGLELRWILAMDLPFWLLVAVLQVPMGTLADRIGRRRVLAIGACAYALTILGFGLTTNYWMLFFDYLLWAVAAAMRSGTDSALLFESLHALERDDRYARIAGRGFALRVAGGAIAVLAGSLLAQHIGLVRTVQLSALNSIVAAGVALGMREPAGVRVRRRYLDTLRDGFAFSWRHAEVRYTILIGSVLLTGTFAPVVLVQPFLIGHHVGTAWFGVYQTPLRLMALVAAVLAAWVQRQSRTGVLLAGMCVIIITAYLGLAVWGATAAFALFLLPALASGLADPLIGAYLNERIANERRATVLSVMPLLFALQAAVFEPVLGFLTDLLSIRAAFGFAAAYFAVGMPPLAVLWWRAHAHATTTLVAPSEAK